MATKQQRIEGTIEGTIEWYQSETGKEDVDMHEMAKWALGKGWKMPEPVSPLDRLAKQFARAAREVVERDKQTGKPYRRFHAYTQGEGPAQLTFWVDIDNPKTTRKKMHKSLTQRRDQMIGDGYQLTLDTDHWNTVRPTEEPIKMDMDLTDDIEWRKNAPDEDAKKKAG